jgi:hypothetical protein
MYKFDLWFKFVDFFFFFFFTCHTLLHFNRWRYNNFINSSFMCAYVYSGASNQVGVDPFGSGRSIGSTWIRLTKTQHLLREKKSLSLISVIALAFIMHIVERKFKICIVGFS